MDAQAHFKNQVLPELIKRTAVLLEYSNSPTVDPQWKWHTYIRRAENVHKTLKICKCYRFHQQALKIPKGELETYRQYATHSAQVLYSIPDHLPNRIYSKTVNIDSMTVNQLKFNIRGLLCSQRPKGLSSMKKQEVLDWVHQNWQILYTNDREMEKIIQRDLRSTSPPYVPQRIILTRIGVKD